MDKSAIVLTAADLESIQTRSYSDNHHVDKAGARPLLDEAEVTPEMRLAGGAALWHSSSLLTPDEANVEETAVEVYLAMSRARR